MKIGLVSDIHSNIVALRSVLSQTRVLQSDRIYCAGDLIGYYSRPNEVIEEIQKHNIRSVKGDHDVAIIGSTPSNFSLYAKRSADWNRREITSENLAFLPSLPEIIREFIDERDIVIAHGSPKNPITEYIFEQNVDEVFLDFNFEHAPDVVVFRTYAQTVRTARQ